MILTILYCLPRILAEYGNIDMSHITESFSFPLEIFAWGLVAICASYAGIDRAALATKSSLMDIGTCDVGNPGRLRAIIVILFFIFAENIFLNLFLGHSVTIISTYGKQEFSGINLPLEGISSALVSTITIYIAGNKTIRLTQNIDNTKTGQDWANEKENIVLTNTEETK